jgi:hypothetical protein
MRKLGMLALVLGLAACANDATAPSTSVDGTYSLKSINGTTLPYTFSDGSRLTSEQLVLNTDGSFSAVSQFNFGQTVESGFYTNLNGAITFSVSGQGTFQGSLSGSVLTEVENGFTQVFQKN